MTFFSSTIDVLQTLVIALGGGLGVWGGINLLEGYGNDNPGAKSQGIKQLMAGDNFKGLPIAIRRKEPGHQAAHGGRRNGAHRHHADSAAQGPVRLIQRPSRRPPV